jgi:WD40 repeat protein
MLTLLQYQRDCYNANSRSPGQLTASGDQTVRLWDIEKQACICVLHRHETSVKSIVYKPSDPSMFQFMVPFCTVLIAQIHLDIIATGSRDGTIKLWDVRCTGSIVGEGMKSSTLLKCVYLKKTLYQNTDTMLYV